MLLTETFRPMNRKSDKNLVVGLDIGTSRVMAIVGEYMPGEPVEVIGFGSHTSRGMKKGVVVEIDPAAPRALKQARRLPSAPAHLPATRRSAARRTNREWSGWR